MAGVWAGKPPSCGSTSSASGLWASPPATPSPSGLGGVCLGSGGVSSAVSSPQVSPMTVCSFAACLLQPAVHVKQGCARQRLGHAERHQFTTSSLSVWTKWPKLARLVACFLQTVFCSMSSCSASQSPLCIAAYDLSFQLNVMQMQSSLSQQASFKSTDQDTITCLQLLCVEYPC